MINEVAYYLYQRGFYLNHYSDFYDEVNDLYEFKNCNMSFFDVEIYVNKDTKEVNEVRLSLDLDLNHMDEIYYKSSVEMIIKLFNTIKEAINKFENDVIIPMCEKFNLIYDGDYFMYDKEYYFSEINKLKELGLD